MSKLYMIVTNDEYELPVKCDVVGAKAVADYMGISITYLRRMMCGSAPWSKKMEYKAVPIGEARLLEKNKPFYNKRYAATHDRSKYYKEYFRKKKGALKDGETEKTFNAAGDHTAVQSGSA